MQGAGDTDFGSESVLLSRQRFLGVSAGTIAGAAFGLTVASKDAFAYTMYPAVPDPTATLVWGTDNPSPHFDPASAQDISNLVAVGNIFEALMTVNAKGGASPEMLAGPPEMVGRRVSVTLRDDLIFHDGTPVTAADVVFTFRRHLNPKTGSIYAPGLTPIRSLRAEGTRRVIFTLKKRSDYFSLTLALVRILSSRAFESMGEANYILKPVGSGPFRVEALQPQVSYELTRFDEYSGRYRRPLLAGIKSEAATEAASRVARLKTGAFHVADHIPITDIASLKSDPTLVVASTAGSAQLALEFEHSKRPFNDVRVRQAFMYAVDRQALSKLVYGGLARPAHSLLPRTSPYYVDPDTKYSYDPEKAKSLLRAAGYRNGVDFEMRVTLVAGAAPSVVLREQLRKVGLRAKLLAPASGQYTFVVQGKYQCLLAYYNIGLFTDPVDFYYRFTLHGANRKAYFRWNDKSALRYDRLVDEAYAASTFKKRRAAYGEAQEILNQVVPGTVSLLYLPITSGWQRKVQNFRVPPNDLSNFRGVFIEK